MAWSSQSRPRSRSATNRFRLRPSRESVDPHLIHESRKTPSDLAEVIDRWEALPEAIRAGIVAMVRAAAPSGDRRRGSGS